MESFPLFWVTEAVSNACGSSRGTSSGRLSSLPWGPESLTQIDTKTWPVAGRWGVKELYQPLARLNITIRVRFQGVRGFSDPVGYGRRVCPSPSRVSTLFPLRARQGSEALASRSGHWAEGHKGVFMII
jgi:hypothetical protein